MLKLTLKPGEYLQMGDEIKVIYTGGSEENIHLLIEAPKEINIARSKAMAKRPELNRGRKIETYRKEEAPISKEAQKEISRIVWNDKINRQHEADAGKLKGNVIVATKQGVRTKTKKQA